MVVPEVWGGRSRPGGLRFLWGGAWICPKPEERGGKGNSSLANGRGRELVDGAGRKFRGPMA